MRVTNIVPRSVSSNSSFCEFVLLVHRPAKYVLTLYAGARDICSLQKQGIQLEIQTKPAIWTASELYRRTLFSNSIKLFTAFCFHVFTYFVFIQFVFALQMQFEFPYAIMIKLSFHSAFQGHCWLRICLDIGLIKI